MHQTNSAAYHAAAAADRKKITCIVQKMQMHIWETYLQTAEEDVKRADEQNAIENALQTLYEPEQDYDYDPFAESSGDTPNHDAHNGETQEDTEAYDSEHNSPILTPKQKHLNYGWENSSIPKTSSS